MVSGWTAISVRVAGKTGGVGAVGGVGG